MSTASTSASLQPSELRRLLLQYRRENWRGIQTPEWQERIVDDLLRDNGETVLREVESVFHIPSKARVLDVGSGVGSFVMACRRRALNAFGVEPDRIAQGGTLTSIQIAQRRLPGSVFISGVGESLPFPDRSFDLVTLNQVIEHVADQPAVVAEAARVVKVGGAIYVACPNYLRFYEPHYKVFWFPFLPKLIGRWYLRLRGRNPVLLDQLTYTTNSRVRRVLSGLGPEYELIDLHRHHFLEKVATDSFVSSRARLAARMMRLPVVGTLIRNAALLFLRVTQGGCEMVVLRRQGADRPC